MSTARTLKTLADMVEEHTGKPSGMYLTLTLGQLRELNARLARLTELTVTAAALRAGTLTGAAAALAAEELATTARTLIAEDPRLKALAEGRD